MIYFHRLKRTAKRNPRSLLRGVFNCNISSWFTTNTPQAVGISVKTDKREYDNIHEDLAEETIMKIQIITSTFMIIMVSIIGEKNIQAQETTPVPNGNMSLEGYDLRTETATHWKLPNRLREISGLAMTQDHRLLAHNDEKGIIFEIDYQNGAIVKAWELSDLSKPVTDDFEGIAVVDDLIYLVTSSGRLYECREGADGEAVLFNMYATGIGRACEIEGLAYDPDRRALLLLCKNPRSPEQEGQISIYRWSIDTKQSIEEAHSPIPIIDFLRHIEGQTFQPSGIERHPVSGNYFVVAARQHAIAEITPDGHVVAVKELSAKQHPQVEGITFAADYKIIVSDEGKGKRARLTFYPRSNP